jgi:hypothetical protein
MLEEQYGQEAMKKSQICGWYKRFRDGRASANDDPGMK